MAEKFDVLSYGTIGMDVILQVPHWPDADVSTHAFTARQTLGGKATNAAAHLAAWGLKVAVSGTIIGDDAMGKQLFRSIHNIQGISTRYLRKKRGHQSMYCIILVRPDGERAIIGVHTDTIETTPPTEDMIAGARILTLDLYGGAERVEAARLASRANVPVIVGDVRQLDHEVLPYTLIAIASAAELRNEYPDLSPDECARRIADSGAKEIIITGGANQVLVFEENGVLTRFDPPPTVAVDTTGAGDAFRAGVVFGKAAGLSTPGAAKIGAAAGSLAVGKFGAATDPAPVGEVLRLADRIEVV
jgi:sugar/nucleoside kinase (ribokinase family)